MIHPLAFLGNLSRISIVTVTFLRGRSLAIIHRPPHTPGREGGGPDGQWVGVRPSSIIYQTLFAPVPSACPSARTGMCLARRPHLVNGFGYMNGRCRGTDTLHRKVARYRDDVYGEAEVGGGRGRNIVGPCIIGKPMIVVVVVVVFDTFWAPLQSRRAAGPKSTHVFDFDFF